MALDVGDQVALTTSYSSQGLAQIRKSKAGLVVIGPQFGDFKNWCKVMHLRAAHYSDRYSSRNFVPTFRNPQVGVGSILPKSRL